MTRARPESPAPSTPYLIRRKALHPQQSLSFHRLAPQGADMPWAQPKGSQGQRPRPTSCSAVLGDMNDHCSPLDREGERQPRRCSTRVTLPSLVYKRRRRTPQNGHKKKHTRTLQHANSHPTPRNQGGFAPPLAQACTPYYKHPGASNTVQPPLLDVRPPRPEPG